MPLALSTARGVQLPNASGLQAVTALALYTSSASAVTLAGASQLYPTQGGTTSTQKSVTVGTALGWGELVAQGTASAWGAGTLAPAPSGKGWLYDSAALENQTIAGGVWQSTMRLASSVGTLTGVFFMRWYAYSVANGYRYLGQSESQLLTLTTTLATTAFSAPSLTPQTLKPGEKFYQDAVCNILNTSTGSGVATIQVAAQGTIAGTGDQRTPTTTPGAFAAYSIIFRQIQAAAAFGGTLTPAKINNGIDAALATNRQSVNVSLVNGASNVGTLLIAAVSFKSATATITAPSGWTVLHTIQAQNTTQTIFGYLNNPGGLNNFAFSTTATASAMSAIVEEWTNVAAASALDQQTDNNGSSVTMDSGTTAATTNANELWWAALTYGAGSARSPGSPTNGFVAGEVADSTTTGGSGCRLSNWTKVASVTGAADVAVTLSSSSTWIGAIVTLIAANTGSTTASRNVPASAALSLTSANSVPSSAGLLATLQRAIPAAVPLLATQSRATPAQAAFLATTSRSVPAAAAFVLTWTRTSPASAALLATTSQNAPAAAALLATVSRQAPATTALLSTATRSVPAAANLSGAGISRLAPASAALLATVSRSAPAAAALLGTRTRLAPASAGVLATVTRVVPASGALLLTNTRNAPASAALLVTLSRAVPASTILAVVKTRAIPASVPLIATQSRVIPAAVNLAGPGISHTVPASIALLATAARVVPSAAGLLQTLSRSAPASLALLATPNRALPSVAALSGTQSRVVTDSAAFLLTLARSVPASLAALQTRQRAIPASVTLFQLVTTTRAIAATAALGLGVDQINPVVVQVSSAPVITIVITGRQV